MSSGQRHDNGRGPAAGTRKPVSLTTLAERKALGEPVVMITAYDYPSARIVDEVGVDLVLVGDSAANVVLGYDSTVSVTVEEMLVLTRAVRRGLTSALLVGDLPFGSYEASDEQAVRTATRFVKEGGCSAVKLERGGATVARARAIIAAGIPVMGHVGLTPQTAVSLGGFRAQGRTAERALQVMQDALDLQEAGCFAVVFEAIPTEVTNLVMPQMDCVVIGIGAGGGTDGQVLVLHDLVGLHHGHVARFVRQFAEVGSEMRRGVQEYAEAVRTGTFPGPEHSYTIPAEQLELLRGRWQATQRLPTAASLAEH